MDCKHEINFLIGDKEGILCQNCGKRFADYADILKEQKPTKAKKEKKDEVCDGES